MTTQIGKFLVKITEVYLFSNSSFNLKDKKLYIFFYDYKCNKYNN